MQITISSRPSKTKSDSYIKAIGEGEAKALSLSAAYAKTPGGLGAGLNKEGELITYLGLGNLSGKNIQTAARKLVGLLAEKNETSVSVDIRCLGKDETLIFSFLRGLLLGRYVLGLWKEQRPTEPLLNCKLDVVCSLSSASAKQVLAKAEAIATGQQAAMHLVDRPANAKKPADVAHYVERLGKQYGFEVEILDEEALEIQGFTGILAVGKASHYPPRLLKLHYKGGDRYHLGLVGKGITFDTGGISIKPSTNMGYMKSDLGGAAAVLGTFISAAMLKLPVELHGLLAVAENAISGDAYLPSDVIRNYGGKTIEIVDTDAEGRIVLADALAYMPEWASPELTIDLATLTGSAVQTFGYECAAIFTNNEAVLASITNAGSTCNEKVWPLPLWAEYEADLGSDVADIKHYHGKPIAGAINAAKFLEYFVADKANWAHLDIAGVAFGTNEFSKDRSGSGYGVGLLTQFLINQTDAV